MKKESAAYQNTLLLLIVITAVAVDISIPILPSITDYFQVDKNQSQLIISSFLAGYGLSMIPIGLSSDRFGRMPVMYIGLIIYVAAGVMIVFSTSFEVLLFGRFLQGIGGGVGPVNARAIARDLVSGKKLAKLMSSLTSALFLAPIFAPILGSQLYQYYGWQVAFLVPPLLGLILLLGVRVTAYETFPQKNNTRSIRQQFSGSTKLILSSQDSIWAILIILTSFAGYQIILTSTSLLIVDIYGIAVHQVGIIFGVTAGLMVAATFYNKKKLQTEDPIKLLKYGILLSLFASIGFVICYLIGDVPFWFTWFFFSCYITSIGFIMPNTSTIALAPLSEIAGFASSVFGAAMILGAAVVTAIAAEFYDGTLFSITGGIILCTATTALIFFVGLPILKKKSLGN